ncbi:MAG: rhomboid family intramembrane serine protease [Paludibacteraceae bacterium]|nr:rhomboid family intramembrane serine protease [Paludibacteraceae bacterium]
MNAYQTRSMLTPAVKNLLILNCLCFLPTLFQSLGQQGFDLDQWAGLHYWQSDKFNIFQLVSYMFLHGSLEHLFCNMLAVFMFGVVIERAWGTRKFLFFYFVTGIGAAITQEVIWSFEWKQLVDAVNLAANTGDGSLLEPYYDKLAQYFSFSGQLSHFPTHELTRLQGLFTEGITDRLVTIGASGAVFGLLLAFGWLFPDAELMLLFFPIPIRARIFVTLYALVELFAGVSNFSGDSVAHFAHLGGMIFGALLLTYWKKKGMLYDD